MKKEEHKIWLKKAEIRKFRKGRGGKRGRTPGRVRKAAVFAAALAGLSLCLSQEVSAAQPGSSTSVLICHKHVGEPSIGGGCYQKTRYHMHTGESSLEGGCYTVAVPHVHTGTQQEMGGCFSREIRHVHSGSPEEGGGCYTKALYHVHEESCRTDASCSIRCVGVGEPYRISKPGWCGCHGNTNYNEAEVTWEHSACGAGRRMEKMQYMTYHGWEDQLEPRSHTYQALNCSLADEITGYERNCGREEGQTERYEINCGKTEQDADRYETGCGKKTGEIDCFDLSCKMEEGAPVIRFRLSADTGEWAKKVVLHAEYEKLGEVQILPESYLWNGTPGKQSFFTVRENGIVSCRLNCGEDSTAREGELQLNITNIDNTPPVITGFEDIPEEWTNQAVRIHVKAEDRRP